MNIQIKRGLEKDRKSYKPKNGELLFTTDKKQLFVGDDETFGGNIIGGICTHEWIFTSQTNTTIYVPTEDEESFHESSNGIYMVFYGATKLSKNDYSINSSTNTFTLNFNPTENGIEINVCYVGL